MKSFLKITLCGMLAAGWLSAQEFPRFSFGIGGGFTNPVGNTGRNLNDGWNIRAGAGMNFTAHLGAMVDVGYDSMSISSGTLTSLGAPGGGVHIFSATLDPVVHLNPHGHVDVYLTGGGGEFHWNQQFTAPSYAVVPGFGFFGYYPAVIATTEILSSYTVNKPGVDVGAGIAFGSMRHGKFFAEARYDHIYMSGSHADYIPVTFGFRW
jgi:hypothetical protein